ncbi:MAG: hypothetical protein VX871_03620, partial [Pseudomonadota bacterium]|nr:hypothetical protein [Pseudomonadota bacterium]
MRTRGSSRGLGTSGGESGEDSRRAPSGAGAVSALLSSASIEISPLDDTAAGKAVARLKPGSDVYIAALPRANYRQIASTAAALRRLGLAPVPHIAARGLASRAELSEFLA